MSGRKRRAPGASPQVQQNVYPQDSNMSTEYNWNDASMAGDMSSFDPSFMNYNPGHSRVVSLDGTDGPDIGSGQLVRRNPNQQLAARGGDPWDAFNSNPGQGGWENIVDDDEELEQKAMLAKKDAMAKRKQIPPFVQKLSSFLDNGNNTNLIRWSDDGNSFIVLDEDEFARTLIPELFKHNNYASFVRQLNMYGFHKKVGLSDNSMKASETKAKAPSEYYNKYFKRGRPELLWLIQKPKNPSSGPKRKRDDENKGDSDEERKYLQDSGGGGGYGEDLTVRGGNQDMAMIPRSEYNSLRNEVRTLQQQQKVISGVLSQIRRQNDQLYQQATAFQTLHDRHENSINAILTFLATFYNRSLEGNTNGVNLADMFGPAIPTQQPHGNVVDVGDYTEKGLSNSPQVPRQKRPLALLPAPKPAQKDILSPGTRAATLSPARSTVSPVQKSGSRQPVFKSPSQTRTPSNTSAQPGRDGASAGPIKVDTKSPPIPENDEIMSAIQNVNASAGQAASQMPAFDFSSALSNYQTQDGNAPLTQQQRNDVLSMMANNTSAASPNSALAQNTNNALVNPQPPPVPDMSQFEATQAQLDFLQKMSDEQNSRVQSLQERLQPLSPSGQIPGLSDNSYFGSTAGLGDPGAYDLDLDSFVQDNDFFPNTSTAHDNSHSNTGDVTLPDLSYQLPDTADLNGTSGNDEFQLDSHINTHHDNDKLNVGAATDGEGRIESISSNATSPSATVEEVEDESRVRRSPKRRKK